MPWLICTTGSPYFQLGQVAHHRFDLRHAFLLLGADAAAGTGIQFGFRDEGQIAVRREQFKTRMQRRHAQHQLGVGLQKTVAAFHRRQVQIVFGEVLLQGFAAAVRFGADHHAAARLQQIAAQVGQRVVGAAVDGDVRHGGRQFGGQRVVRFRNRQARVGLGQAEELLVGQEQRLGRQDRPLAVGLQKAVARLGIGPEAANGRIDLAHQGQRGVGRQVVEQGGRLLEDRGR